MEVYSNVIKQKEKNTKLILLLKSLEEYHINEMNKHGYRGLIMHRVG